MKNIFLILSGFLFTGLILNGCSKNPLDDMTQEESRIYITQRDSLADFSNYRTFAIVDSVAVVKNQGEGKELTDGDAQLLQLLTQKMEERGYTLVDSTQLPDLGVNATRISHTYLNAVPYPYDYWGYPGYWNPGVWGYPGYDYYFPPGFGYYPPTFMYYNTQSDVMAIDIIDLKNSSKNENKLKAIWNASLKGEGVLNSSNYPSEVAAIFEQSPYLTNK